MTPEFDELASPVRLAEELRRAPDPQGAPIIVYWVRVQRDRHDYAQQLAEEVSDEPMVPLVVSIDGFRNPNAVLLDVVRLLESSQDAVQRAFKARPRNGTVTIILVARGPLGVAQASSPVALPSWVPEFGGQTVECFIQDASTTLTIPLNAPEADIDAIRAAHFRLEGALLDRLQHNLKRDHTACNRLLELVREARNSKESLEDYLAAARTQWEAVATSSAFRPSIRQGKTLSAILLRIFLSASGPDGLHKAGKAMASALQPTDFAIERSRPSLAAILYGPSSPTNDRGVKWGADLLRTLYSTYSFTTAAAHADQYPKYPIPLLKSTSRDIRRHLTEFRTEIERLSSE